METKEIASLRAENARLHQIIDILIENNRFLKNIIANAGYRNSQKEKDIAFAEVYNGYNEKDITFADVSNGYKNSDISFAEPDNGYSEKNTDPAVRNNSHKINFSEAVKGIAEPNKTALQLPSTIACTPTTINQLAAKFVKGQHKMNKVSARQNTARLILHFYNKNKGDYTTLQQLTGMTKSGLQKLLAMLKKRGLITRTGWQQFEPGSPALQLLAESFAVPGHY